MRVHIGNTMNLPIESMEASLPLRFHAYGLIDGSGDAGPWQGGEGVRKKVEILADDVNASVLSERSDTAALGVSRNRRVRSGEVVECAVRRRICVLYKFPLARSSAGIRSRARRSGRDQQQLRDRTDTKTV